MRHGEDLTPDEREKWLVEGQAWFDGWQAEGYPYDDESVRRAYDLAGMAQSLTLAAILKESDEEHAEVVRLIADLAIEEADQIAKEWEDEHGEPYHSFTDVVEFIVHDLTVNGLFIDGRTEGIDLEGWHVPDIAVAYFFRGMLAYDDGDYEESLRWHKRSLEVNPVCAPTLLEVSECYKKTGDMEQALEYAQQALCVAWQMPMVAKARRTIAFCEGELGHHDLCAANLVVANDYERTPIVANELLWLRQQGWNGKMTLEEALRLAPEEIEGLAVSKLVREAGVATFKLVREGQIADRKFALELMGNLAMASREERSKVMTTSRMPL